MRWFTSYRRFSVGLTNMVTVLSNTVCAPPRPFPRPRPWSASQLAAFSTFFSAFLATFSLSFSSSSSRFYLTISCSKLSRNMTSPPHQFRCSYCGFSASKDGTSTIFRDLAIAFNALLVLAVTIIISQHRVSSERTPRPIL